ncbi:Protein asteroid 1 [Amphibalanus amphitrite]|uniref:Protein asteroid 1 n=1 Tax=Amphibalanus amphitrite TaxID=1232801 RepID=A0A6A4VBY1_AMPAM|nr:Protein asteroid 1 [Amphibalanus amphitrite]
MADSRADVNCAEYTAVAELLPKQGEFRSGVREMTSPPSGRREAAGAAAQPAGYLRVTGGHRRRRPGRLSIRPHKAMGVGGLTQFLKRRGLLREEPISRCRLVIDGHNLFWVLFERLANVPGGVCQEFTRQLKTFFHDLRRCDISPLVFLDGTSDCDCHKLPSILQRMKSEIERPVQGNITAETAEKKSCPLLLKTLFTQVLRNLGIPFAECLFEADLPCAAMARRLGCAVMSNDSDFFTLGVTCVRIPVRRVSIKLGDPDSDHSSSFMTCTVFRPQSEGVAKLQHLKTVQRFTYDVIGFSMLITSPQGIF